MKLFRPFHSAVAVIFSCALLAGLSARAQNAAATPVVELPHLVSYSGSVSAPQGEPVTLRFSLYQQQTGGEAVWAESQWITPDAKGRYAVLLGSATEGGLPQAVFSSAQAKWLGVTIGGGEELARTPLLATPYTLKASDAETVGGHPASDFVLAGSRVKPGPDTATNVTQINTASGILGGGTGPTVSLTADPAYFNTYYGQLAAANSFTASNSFAMPIASTVATGTAPLTIASTTAVPNLNASLLGGVAAAGFPQLALQNTYASNQIIAPSAPATTGTGHSSNFLWMNASVWNSSTSKAQNIGFQWRAEPLNNDTASPNANFALLSTVTSATPQETGFKITANGIITFVAAQTFPGTVSTTGNNTFTGNQTINGEEYITANDYTSTTAPIVATNTSTKPGSYGMEAMGYSGILATGTGGGGTGGYGLIATAPGTGAQGISSNTSGQGYGLQGFASSANTGGVGVSGSGYTGLTATGSSAPVNGSTPEGIGLTATGAYAVIATSNESDSYGFGVSATGGTTFNGTGTTYTPATTGVGVSTSGGIGMIATSTDPNSVGYGLVAQGGNDITVFTPGGPVFTGIGIIASGAIGIQATGTDGFAITGTGSYVGAEFTGGCCNTVTYTDNLPSGVEGIGGVGVLGLSEVAEVGRSANVGWGVIGALPEYTDTRYFTTNGAQVGASTAAGVWGDGRSANGVSTAGVLATADGSSAIIASNNGVNPTVSIYNQTSTAGEPLLETYSPNVSSSDHCIIDSSADISCTGTFTNVEKVKNERQVAMYSMTSPENWHEDFGSAKLVNGIAYVPLEPIFGSSVNTDIEYHVFLSPRGDSEGLFVAEQDGDGFKVREQRHGTSSIVFDYRIVAKRKGFEQVRMEDLTDRVNENNRREAEREEAAKHPPVGVSVPQEEAAKRAGTRLPNPLPAPRALPKRTLSPPVEAPLNRAQRLPPAAPGQQSAVEALK